MGMNHEYAPSEPSRDEVDKLPGATLLEFGSQWCGHCRRAQRLIEEAITGRDELRHIKVEDASGRRLGRSFGVKLWPTLVFLRDGVEVARLVRPADSGSIREAASRLAA